MIKGKGDTVPNSFANVESFFDKRGSIGRNKIKRKIQKEVQNDVSIRSDRNMFGTIRFLFLRETKYTCLFHTVFGHLKCTCSDKCDINSQTVLQLNVYFLITLAVHSRSST